MAELLLLIQKRANNDNQIRGTIPHLEDDGLLILHYADDTIILMDHDMEQAKNMKLLLSVFKQLSSVKINFHKSEIFCYGKAKEFENQHMSSLDAMWVTT